MRCQRPAQPASGYSHRLNASSKHEPYGSNTTGYKVYLLRKQIRNDGDPASLLCLVLFEPKPGHEIQCPAWGSFTELPTNSMASAYWNLVPLVLSGRTYFVLSLRRLLTGVPEDPQEYISSCRANGVFRRTFVPVPTRAEARRDALALHQSCAWKALKWKDHDEYGSYDLSEQSVWAYIKAQADAVR